MLFYVNTDNILSNLVYHVKNDTWLPGNLAQLRREVAAHSGIASAYWPQTEPLGGGFDQWTVVTQLAATKKLEMLTGNLNIHTKTDATSLFEGGWPIPTRKDGTTGSFDGSDDVLPVDGTSIATILNRDPATNGFTSRIFYQRSDGMIQATVLNLTFWLTNEHIRNEYDAFNDLRPSVISGKLSLILTNYAVWE